MDITHRIARATNLRKLAVRETDFRDPRVNVQLNVLRSDDQPLDPADTDTLIVRDKEQMQVKIRNKGTKAIAVAVFYIQNDFAIKTFFPRSYGDFRNVEIEKGGELYRSVKFNINATTLGWEDVIVIAVDAADRHAIDDILKLQQDGFPSRTRSGGSEPTPFRSPLGRLIDDAMNGGTRGPAAALDSYAIRRVSWNVVAD